MEVSLRKAEKSDDPTLRRLWDLYSYDFSLYNNEDILDGGNYDFYYNADYYDNDRRACYFIIVDNHIGGFVSVSHDCDILKAADDVCVVDFFVMNKYRKGGVGRRAAYAVFDLYHTNWEVAQYENNEISKKFWKNIIADYTGNKYLVRSVIKKECTLQAIIFNSRAKESENVANILQKMDGVYHIKLFTRPSEEIKNELLRIAEQSYPTSREEYKNLRCDLQFQDVLTVGTEEQIGGFFMFTSHKGNVEITFAAIVNSLRHHGVGSNLMRAFKYEMAQRGFDNVFVDFSSVELAEKLKNLWNFYLNNGFSISSTQPYILKCSLN